MTFQQIIETYGREISVQIYNLKDRTTIESDQIRSLNYRFDGALYTSVMRCCDIMLEGRNLIEDGTRLRIKLTASANGESKELYLGIFNVYGSAEYDDSANTTKLICYDDMIKAMKPYDPSALDLNYPISKDHPVNLKTLLAAVCTKVLGDPVGVLSDLKNGDKYITSDKYRSEDEKPSAYTYRDVLDDIAKSAGCSLAFKSKETLDGISNVHIIYVTDGNGNMKSESAALDIDNFKDLKIGEHYGPVDTVILSRSPQEDNVYYPESDTHLCEVKLNNVQIVESNDSLKREDWLPAIYNAVKGTEYQCYELESFGIAFLNFGDVFKIRTFEKSDDEIDYESPVEYTSVFMRTDLTINTGMNEKSLLEMPVATSTNYSAATNTEKMLYQTMLQVDKQRGIIESFISNVEGAVSKIEQAADSINTVVEWYDENHESENLFIPSSEKGFSAVTPSSGDQTQITTTDYPGDAEMKSGYRKYAFTPSSTLFSMFLPSEIISDYSELKSDCYYNLSFYAKSDNEMSVITNTSLMQIFEFIKDNGGISTKIPLDFSNSTSAIQLTNEWQQFSFTFSLEEQDAVISAAEFTFYFVCSASAQNFYLSECKLTSVSGKSIQAKLDMYVEKDDNNRIVSMLNASADTIRLTAGRLIIESGNFQLTSAGDITAKSGTIGGWSLADDMIYSVGNSSYTILKKAQNWDVGDDFPVIIAAGAESLNAYDDANFVLYGNGDVRLAGNESTGCIYAKTGGGLAFYNEGTGTPDVVLKSFVENGNSFTVNLMSFGDKYSDPSFNVLSIKSIIPKIVFSVFDSGKIVTPFLGLTKSNWGYGNVTSAERYLLTTLKEDTGFVISANGGSKDLFLEGNNVNICGRLKMLNYFDPSDSGKERHPLYINYKTGEITT